MKSLSAPRLFVTFSLKNKLLLFIIAYDKLLSKVFSEALKILAFYTIIKH
ncbi:hypothetical protein CLOSYM_01657 [[Clostridium] symbiosum ATCC 14940]|uniref:Uncharacterized protein n=1 Tax=[Clostridium] symbiosum ATCC 14940 TaxID=411472 RepID=A0ABC9TZD2_CLOSY|nr:hypothetical protein CLOSYM_01657 [[Clostridium] symbiosum ATCC 14940]